MDSPASAATAPSGEPLSAKGQATRSAIIDAALHLFEQHGYDKTTMRAIATEAGVSLGNAYYYFSSKEHLIQGFYDRAGDQHLTAARTVLGATTDFETRLARTLELWIDTMAPYRAFAASFFRNAADPASPLSPFSPESAPARNASIEFLRDLVETSEIKPPKAVRDELPELLWLFQMGIVLYWVHDRSDDAVRTRTLAARTVPLVTKAVSLAKLPVLRGIVADLVGLIDELKRL